MQLQSAGVLAIAISVFLAIRPSSVGLSTCNTVGVKSSMNYLYSGYVQYELRYPIFGWVTGVNVMICDILASAGYKHKYPFYFSISSYLLNGEIGNQK